MRAHGTRGHRHDRSVGDHPSLTPAAKRLSLVGQACRRQSTGAFSGLVPTGQRAASVTEIGIDQLVHRPVFDQHGLEQQQRLQHHVHAGSIGVCIKSREQRAIRRRCDDALQLQPLRGKAVAKPLEAFVTQHPIHLRREHCRLMECLVFGQLQQLVVGDAAPQEKRKARGQVEVIPDSLDRLVVQVQKTGRTQHCRGDVLHAFFKRHPVFQLQFHFRGVARNQLRRNRSAERPSQKSGQALMNQTVKLVPLGLRFSEKLSPDAAALGREIVAVHDRLAQLVKRLHLDGRHREVIPTIVESVFRPQILRERPHSSQTRLDHLRLAKRPAAHVHRVRHFARRRVKVAVAAHHFLRQRKHLHFKFEQILHSVIVLKSIHPPDGRLGKSCPLGQAELKQVAQLRNRRLPDVRF